MSLIIAMNPTTPITTEAEAQAAPVLAPSPSLLRDLRRGRNHHHLSATMMNAKAAEAVAAAQAANGRP
jgi:hypothetical protein